MPETHLFSSACTVTTGHACLNSVSFPTLQHTPHKVFLLSFFSEHVPCIIVGYWKHSGYQSHIPMQRIKASLRDMTNATQ
ncbi:hypothetical protein CEP54_010196 [Fusarium duplospermum]|uniref:Uncharacterized protein n=1 Tax=Fusarium duplospermum TaxID=1325734 RepID=A0A428PLA2_9HYPO|nr:hypothetical protein CEP54_010196 [Fusarium duplospermum]